MKDQKKIGEILSVAIPIIERLSRFFLIGKRARAVLATVAAILTVVKNGLPADDLTPDDFVMVYSNTDLHANTKKLNEELAKLESTDANRLDGANTFS